MRKCFVKGVGKVALSYMTNDETPTRLMNRTTQVDSSEATLTHPLYIHKSSKGIELNYVKIN